MTWQQGTKLLEVELSCHALKTETIRYVPGKAYPIALGPTVGPILKAIPLGKLSNSVTPFDVRHFSRMEEARCAAKVNDFYTFDLGLPPTEKNSNH